MLKGVVHHIDTLQSAILNGKDQKSVPCDTSTSSTNPTGESFSDRLVAELVAQREQQQEEEEENTEAGTHRDRDWL